MKTVLFILSILADVENLDIVQDAALEILRRIKVIIIATLKADYTTDKDDIIELQGNVDFSFRDSLAIVRSVLKIIPKTCDERMYLERLNNELEELSYQRGLWTNDGEIEEKALERLADLYDKKMLDEETVE